MDANAAKALATESGNSFQSRVVTYLRTHGWTVLVSPYYVDSATDKPRESDLIAEKVHQVPLTFGGPLKNLRMRLFIECKYITEGTVFWTDTMEGHQAHSWVYSHTPFVPNHVSTGRHHYFQNERPVAKLFASEKKKGEEGDAIFRALNQCLNGYVHNQARDSLLVRGPHERVTQVDYPVLLCSDFAKFFSTAIAAALPIRCRCKATSCWSSTTPISRRRAA